MHSLHVLPFLIDWMPLFDNFDMYSKIRDPICFGDEVLLYSSGFLIFMQLSQQTKTQFQFGRLLGDELIYL